MWEEINRKIVGVCEKEEIDGTGRIDDFGPVFVRIENIHNTSPKGV